ncbi:CopG family transcriptional regulator [Hellea sp.]|nr:CopG family transcriptional regulator [Hellea sp.]
MTTSLRRIQAYAPEDIHKRLELAASHPDVSKSEIVRRALELYLSAEAEAARNNPILRRLDQMTRECEKLRQRLIVLSEGHALFVRYFLTLVPPSPEGAERQAARAEGAARFESYRQSLETILSSKNRHLFNGIEDAFLAESDFFSDADLDALENKKPSNQKGSSS